MASEVLRSRRMVPTANWPEFQRILRKAEQAYDFKKKDTAKAIGITASRYTKLFGGKDYSLSVENCLRLAKIARVPPQSVLRAAGKADMANLLDQLYGISAIENVQQHLEQMTPRDVSDAIGPLLRLPEGVRVPILEMVQKLSAECLRLTGSEQGHGHVHGIPQSAHTKRAVDPRLPVRRGRGRT